MPNLRGKTWTTTTPANVEDAQYWEDHLISDEAATKAASSVQSVNNTTPDAQGNVDIVALPSGGTVGQVLTKQSSTAGDADWEDPASSGHTIEDEDGNSMPYQETLQFVNAEVSNDISNSRTVVDCKGSKGDPGDAATIAVGTVTTLPAGSNATVTNAGTSSAAVFNFGIPQGQDGTGAVNSVNGKVGVVVLDATDINLDVPISMLSGTMLTVEDAVHGLDTEKQDAFLAGDGLKFDSTNPLNLKLDLDLLAGSNITLTTTSGSIVISSHGGGMLPYLYIDSEAGATVTVNQPDGTVITPTATGSGHWECELTGGYGTYVIHSILAGQGDATQSLVVDTVMEYHVTDTHYDHTVSFVAPSGSTVRIEGGTEIYTLTGTGSTQSQAVHSASTSFTVTATMDGNGKPYTFTTPSTTGQTTTIPSGTFDFGTINVTVAQDFVTAGSTITCALSPYNTIAKTAASSLTFRVPSTGTWDISGTIGVDTYTTSATVTSLSTPVLANLQTLPDGSTVLPTDDIPTWLLCGGLSSTGYTTLSQVLADSTTLLALMSNNNAVDYLVRSTTWATDICADSTAMTDIGANNYCADTLLGDADWLDAIANSTYMTSVLNIFVPTMNSYTQPRGTVTESSSMLGYEGWKAFDWGSTYGWLASTTPYGKTGEWVAYEFDTINRTYIADAWLKAANDTCGGKIQAYDENNGEWVDISSVTSLTSSSTVKHTYICTNNTNEFKKYRWIFTGSISNPGAYYGIFLNFYGREDV